MANFHIHIDAVVLAPALEELLCGLGFKRMDFLREEEDGPTYAPLHHLTLKTTDPSVFRHSFERVQQVAEETAGLTGYIEGEYLPFDDDILWQPFDPSIPLPFRLRMARLPPGAFRESEVHVTFDRDRSDPRLSVALRQMGLLPASAPKPYGTAKILTAQGTRDRITELLTPLRDYLERAGGAVACSIKNERIVRWWASSPLVQVPPIVEHIGAFDGSPSSLST